MADGRQRRKRVSRSKAGRNNPAASEALRKKWQDPEYRAQKTKFNREVLPVKRPTRVGVPNGMTRAQAEPLWEQARKDADLLMAQFEKEGRIEFKSTPVEQEEALPNGMHTDAEMARLVLREALVLALSPLKDVQTKATAARIVLEWTKPKPATKSELKLQGEEAWLAEVLEDHHAATNAIN
jgi:hypothetical protein